MLRSVDEVETDVNGGPVRKLSKRGRVGEGRPTIYTPELAERLAEHIATGLTDEEAFARQRGLRAPGGEPSLCNRPATEQLIVRE
jgi:hypothetical protein